MIGSVGSEGSHQLQLRLPLFFPFPFPFPETLQPTGCLGVATYEHPTGECGAGWRHFEHWRTRFGFAAQEWPCPEVVQEPSCQPGQKAIPDRFVE